MKRLSTARTWVATGLVLASAGGWAMPPGGAGLVGTAHDFTATGSADVKGPPAAGLCVFCHTPQRAPGGGLLWNHALSPNTFRWDVARTSSGTPLPGIVGTAYKGTSARCLGCHDGSVAIGDVASFDGQPGAGPAILSSARMTDFDPRFQVGVGGDLKGNHPVGVPYPMGGTPNHYNGITNAQLGGAWASNEWQADPTASSNANVRLYVDDGAGNISALARGAFTMNAGIECSSCHDPHNKASVDVMFLRGKLAGRSRSDGYLCEQCHSM